MIPAQLSSKVNRAELDVFGSASNGNCGKAFGKSLGLLQGQHLRVYAYRPHFAGQCQAFLVLPRLIKTFHSNLYDCFKLVIIINICLQCERARKCQMDGLLDCLKIMTTLVFESSTPISFINQVSKQNRNSTNAIRRYQLLLPRSPLCLLLQKPQLFSHLKFTKAR